MNFGDVVGLISAEHQLDGVGNDVPVETTREVFADVRSVYQTEALRGGQAGLSPVLKVLVRRCDYQDERTVELNGRRYAVYRTYCAGDIAELYLERRVGGAWQTST